MDPRAGGRRDLVVLSVLVVAVSRAADGPILWLVGALVFAGVATGWRHLLALGEPHGIAVEALVLPGAASLAGLGAIRLLPLGLGTIPALAVFALLLDRCLAFEARSLAGSRTPSADRAELVVLSVLTAFAGFAGAATILPGGLAEPLAPVGAVDPSRLAALGAADAGLAALLGFRIAAFARPSLRAALIGAVTYGAIVAVAAGAVRALAMPRLVGPVLLTVVFFLWSFVHAAGPVRPRDVRWVWEVLLIGLLGAVVVALNLRLPA
jgi:hypothetical protein